jgi:hypothetical protein
LPPDIVAAVRAAGWELVPAGWPTHMIVDRTELSQGLTTIHDELAVIVPTLTRVVEAATCEATARDEGRPIA